MGTLVPTTFRRIAESHATIQRQDSRRGFFIARTQTVLPTIRGVEIRMGLKDKVRLRGEPEARVHEMREHRFGIGGTWSRTLALWQRCGKLLRGGGEDTCRGHHPKYDQEPPQSPRRRFASPHSARKTVWYGDSPNLNRMVREPL